MQPLIDKLNRGNMTFAKDLDERVIKLVENMPEFKNQD
jgi:hypothetical protein